MPKVDPEGIACLPYSSGTTGLPKGVALTHQNLIANILQCSHPDIIEVSIPTGTDDQEKILSVLPFFHIYGFNAILNVSMYHGIHVVTIPKFTPNDYLLCLEEHRPTAIFAVPSLILFLATHPEVKAKHLESVKRIICAAAPLSQVVIEKFKQTMNRDDFTFEQGYGMTELSPVALFTPKAIAASKLGSVGRLVPSTAAKLIGLDDGKDICKINQSGELLLKGPQVMKGYLNNQKATDEILDDEGWLHTGDVAFYDEDEYFYIIDRTKELIKVKGNQVAIYLLPFLLIFHIDLYVRHSPSNQPLFSKLSQMFLIITQVLVLVENRTFYEFFQIFKFVNPEKIYFFKFIYIS